MTTIDRRHHGRSIRKARRHEQRTGEGTVFVRLSIDTEDFARSLERILTRLRAGTPRRRQLLHNGRKPR